MSDLRAPAEDGAILAEPPLEDIERLLAENDRRFQQASVSVFDMPFAEVRANVRTSAIALANSYAVANQPTTQSRHRLIVSGHQPEMFHPGVWIKNFAIHGLAQRIEGASLNLIIDNDAPKSTFLRIPINDKNDPHWSRLPFDRWQPGLAYEECNVQDEALFAEFAEATEPMTADWDFEPLLPEYWRRVRSTESQLLGERIAAARRSLEREWGCHNLELPMRLLCQTDGFCLCAGHLFAKVAEFHQKYNDVLAAYRLRHGMQSENHPVPNLMQDGEWLETPFWVWRSGEQRQRLWARANTSQVDLRGEASAMPSLNVKSRSGLLNTWADLEAHGYKIRTRALTTTLFARLFLADLFVHGIGGAIYDEITDDLIRQFYHIEPPRFMVLSATLRLPFPRADVTHADCRELERLQRDLFWNPQRHVDTPNAQGLIEEKQRWIDQTCTTKRERRERFRMLRNLTEQLRTDVRTQIDDARTQAQRCASLVKANEVLGRRDYAFCLYPAATLRELFARVTR